METSAFRIQPLRGKIKDKNTEEKDHEYRSVEKIIIRRGGQVQQMRVLSAELPHLLSYEG
jgi:hypothetical protein